MESFQAWERKFEAEVLKRDPGQDPAHDLAHLKRVVATAKSLADVESAHLGVVIPAAWFHDLVNLPKSDPRRRQASRLSAQEAQRYLEAEDYRLGSLEEIGHAIEAHSFSADIEPRTIEAAIVQDADRLDALGAIGIARCFTVGSLLKRPFYEANDPFARERSLDDLKFTLDHFPVKLLKLSASLKTTAGRAEGERRTRWMREFLKEFALEIGVSAPEW